MFNMRKEFTKEKVAVKHLNLGINNEECFGLLGHNGAGKTTTINMLTGLFSPSSGEAFVNDRNIKEDLLEVRREMGVCPQHDVLWDDLNAQEHLLFYGRLKGFWGAELNRMVTAAMESVQLGEHKWKLVKEFSGGMKRRLSVACSLIGDPSVVYLDEPSTGLDPASKHRLWSVVQEAKKGKSIILTTHSMEEAEVLCDRIGIMADGFLQCIGTSSEMKLRFGDGYTLNASINRQIGGID